MTPLETYLRRHDAVEGWLDGYSARFIAAIGAVQRERGVAGSVAEIGVHRGRLFILLKLLAAPGERACAVDLFERQDANVDRSGRGDRSAFLANLRRWADDDGLAILAGSSLALAADAIIRQVGRCRLFSIDGGHTAECAANDLALADEALDENGVAILDDYFNASWPDVATGASRYLTSPSSRLRPFAVTPNKVYLARPSAHVMYVGALRRSQSGFFEKESRMFDTPVSLFGLEPATWSLARRARRALKASAVGPPLLLWKERRRRTAT